MNISLENLNDALENKLLNYYLLSGDEPLLIKESLDLIRSAAAKVGFNSKEIYNYYNQKESCDWNEILSSQNTLSLFSEKKILEIRLHSLRLGRSGSSSILEVLNNSNDDVLIIISCSKLDKAANSTKWVKHIRAVGGIIQVWSIKGNQLRLWLKNKFREKNLTINQGAIDLLIDRVDGNLLAASQAVEKIYLSYQGKDINEKIINAVISDGSRYNVFELIDMALQGKLQLCLKILSKLKNEGTDAVPIIALILKEIRALAKISGFIDDGLSATGALNKAISSKLIWESRKHIVHSCLRRHNTDVFFDIVKSCINADSVAKGQKKGEVWQLISNILIQLTANNVRD
tara:strand:- start:2367 stop:3404 length:1038 start_codon:yes stop_codon:yes gene_type:complete